MGSLYIEKDRWQIIGPTEPGPQRYGTGGEMAIWTSDDEGTTWKRSVQLTSGSIRNHSYSRRPQHANEAFYSFWADGNADKFSESKLYFCNKDGTKLYLLPYDMKNDFEKPVVLKSK